VINILDVQLAIDQSMGQVTCSTANFLLDGCTQADVQIVLTAALGGLCNAGQTAQSIPPTSSTDSMTIYEVDGVNQTGRPISFGRVFAQGEFPQCLQPAVGGAAIGNYQVDVKNRWPDSSVKITTVSFVAPAFGPGGSLAVTFQPAASCNNTGYLTQSQMTAFNSGNWDADIEVTAGGTTNVADAKAMVAGLGMKDCQLTYWLQGPVVTQVIAQDCTASTAYDFGWSWNGSGMSNPVSGNASTASLHPIFVLSFYPSTNSVQVEYILENMWTGRAQDQQYSLTLKAGTSGLSPVYTKPQFTHIFRSRWHKTFWAGTAPGHIRSDHNFSYLKSTKALQNYDPAVTVDAGADYNTYASDPDHGDIAQMGWASSAWPQGWDGDYADDNEGAPLQREDLWYLYNMNAATAKDGKSCGIPNSDCAKAWAMNTGEIDNNPATIIYTGITGGGGSWSNLGNSPFHIRESRTDPNTHFYCPGYADKNATPSASCLNTDGIVQTGRPLSRDAYPQTANTEGQPPVTPVGTVTGGKWGSVGDCSHWLDYSYVPYILTGSWYYLDEEYQEASFCLSYLNGDPGSWYSNGFFAYINPSFYSVVRQFAWGLQVVGRAAFIAPDGSVEQNYYTAKLNSNMEVEEGVMNITGTTLTPTSADGNGSVTACSGNNWNRSQANRWNWGRCTVASYCNNTGSGTCTAIPEALHNIGTGACTLGLVTGATWSNGTATYTVPAGSINPGDPVQVMNMSPSGYNTGSTKVTVTSATGSTVSIPMSTNPGTASSNGNISNDPTLNWAAVTDKDAYWHEGFLLNTLGQFQDFGFFTTTPVFTQLGQRAIEALQDTSTNPYLIALYEWPVKNGPLLCNDGSNYYSTTLNPYISTWAGIKAAATPVYQAMATFNPTGPVPQFPCADHGYSLVARAAASWVTGLSSTCTQGTCTGQGAWNWISTYAPYFNNSPPTSSGCGANYDVQIKFAIVPR
jgi:hypothetical protein